VAGFSVAALLRFACAGWASDLRFIGDFTFDEANLRDRGSIAEIPTVL